VYVDIKKNYFSFVFVICSSKTRTRHVGRDLFTEKVLSRRDNFNSRLARSFSYDDSTLATLHLCNFKLAPYFYTLRLGQPLSAPPGRVCERIARIEIVPAREYLFLE